MNRHTITEAELDDHVERKRQQWTEFATSLNNGHLKRLDICINHVSPTYRVTFLESPEVSTRTIYVGALKETAIREYNALP